MATPFLQRYMDSVRRYLADPHTSRRTTDADLLLMLDEAMPSVWERIMRMTGGESTVGKAWATVTLVEDQAIYPLPGNFRQFISFKRMDSDDPNSILDWIGSISMYDSKRGVEILSGDRGFQVVPTPDDTYDGQEWTLEYLARAVGLHYGTTASVTSPTGTGTSLVVAPASVTAGTQIKLDDYYIGSILRIVSATIGFPQTRRVTGYEFDTPNWVFTVEPAFDVIPTGTIVYEIAPDLPPDYDQIYALTVAIRLASQRKLWAVRGALKEDLQTTWHDIRRWVESNVADRGETHPAAVPFAGMDPYDVGDHW